MSGGGVSQAADVIPLSELEQLIKFLGLLGSAHDGEALNAARFAARWLVKHGTDWRTLLTPEEEVGVSGVVAADEPTLGPPQSELETAYQCGLDEGIRRGMAQMAAQLKAQAAQMGPFYSGYGGHPAQAAMGGLAGGLGGGLGGAGQANAPQGPLPPGAAQAPPQGPGGAAPANPWTAGTWQAVAFELQQRCRQGIPGVFRNGREEQFVADVLGRGFKTLTAAQETWLRDIAGRSGLSW